MRVSIKPPLSIFHFFIVVLAPVLGITRQTHGSVVLHDSYAAPTAGDAPTDLGEGIFGYEINLGTEDFSAAGRGKLVMVYSGWDSANADSTITKVTYGGAALTEAVFANDNGFRVTAGVYYLDNVVTDGTLRIELVEGGQGHFGFGLYALDGLKLGVQDAASGRDPLTDATVSMTTNSGFFVQQATRNNQTLFDDPEDDYLTLFNYSINSFRALSQYQVTTAPGEYLAPIGNTGINFRTVATAAFEGLAGPLNVPQITSIIPLGSDIFELALIGKATTEFSFYASNNLDFASGSLIQNLTKGTPTDAGTIGGNNQSVLTTDANGNGKVQITLTGEPVKFIRAQTTTPQG